MPSTLDRKHDAADAAAMAILVPEEARGDLEVRVAALLARNASLDLIETAREDAHVTKRDLARKAGLDESAVRKLLTSSTANPTSEIIFRLMRALGIRVEAITPSGARVSLL